MSILPISRGEVKKLIALLATVNDGDVTTSKLADNAVTAAKISKVFTFSSTVTFTTTGQTWLPPAGVYTLSVSSVNGIKVSVNVGGTWYAGPSSLSGCSIVSDGANVRIENVSGTAYVRYRRLD